MTYKPRTRRPHCWTYPHDEDANKKHLAHSRASCQARFRNEGWAITEHEWMYEIWPDHLWQRRGRQGTDLCLIRHDNTKAWSKANCLIVTRRTQLILQKPNKESIETAEVEPGVWDITGDTLKKHLASVARHAKYKGRYR
jgi:hypothetical protein